MNVKHFIAQSATAAALAMASNVALADDIGLASPVGAHAHTLNLTPTDVRAELAQARKQGQLLTAGDFLPVAAARSPRTDNVAPMQLMRDVHAGGRPRLDGSFLPG